MRRLFNRLLDSLHISGRDFAPFLLALLLAFSIWLIHNLSLRYNDYLQVSVSATSSLDGYAQKSTNKCEVIARCRARGYTVIQSKLRKKKVIEVEFSPSTLKHKGSDIFYVTSSVLQDYAHIFFGDDATVEYYVTDTLFFRFPSVNHKRVPVIPVTSLTYRSQYVGGPITLVPDSVTVYGEPYVLKNISGIQTVQLRMFDLDHSVDGMVHLEPVRGVRTSVDQVRYSVDVVRYVQMKRMVPITFTNVPSDKEFLVFPSEVEVTLKCIFPLMSDPFDNFSVVADYSSFLGSLSGKCKVEPKFMPVGVISFEADPPYVDCLVGDK